VTDLLELPFNATTAVPPGMIAAVVTSLEMHAQPSHTSDPDLAGQAVLTRLGGKDVERYLAMYRTLGHRWMWFSRLILPPASVAAILDDPGVTAFCLSRGGEDIGLLELDFRIAGECELAFFGLVEAAIGQGAGRWMMNRALELAWAQPIARLWVHTCTFDHPGAPDFYRNSGFRVFRTGIEIADDPRLSGHLPRDAAAHVPMLES
jgi:GNAT superfamily N-acetyltransferase